MNGVISDHAKRNSKFRVIYVKNFFLKTPMDTPYYLRIHSQYLSMEFKKEYKLEKMIDQDGYIYCQINICIYSLKQAVILAYKLLVQRLAKRRYHLIPLTTGLFKQATRSTTFALCVNDFGIKYNNEDVLQHFINTLQQHYEISIDREGRHHCRLTFN